MEKAARGLSLPVGTDGKLMYMIKSICMKCIDKHPVAPNLLLFSKKDGNWEVTWYSDMANGRKKLVCDSALHVPEECPFIAEHAVSAEC